MLINICLIILGIVVFVFLLIRIVIANRIGEFILFTFSSVYITIQYKWMSNRIKKFGWTHEILPTGNMNVDGWVHPRHKNNGYNTTGVFTLYGAYLTTKKNYGTLHK